jgi:hypothetical protein
VLVNFRIGSSALANALEPILQCVASARNERSLNGEKPPICSEPPSWLAGVVSRHGYLLDLR